ncbi:MAG: protein kinase, partial [Planctomycetota bacterium]|nr:protein kinase [Planctomycetota bacterium]
MEGISFGDFKVIKKIAEGGMGQVYLARQISLDRDVALKILPERLAKDESFKARFEREAREAARLNHPSIISVYAYGIKDGIPYFAMEFIEGEDLAGLLKKRGKFPVREALRITKEVAKALEAAHKKGVVHRDIKPSNIMLKEDGSVKVTDFGLAKAVGGGSVMVTQANVVLGTPHYMSPEQGKGEKVDTRSDIYSLGVVLYELLSGTVPFKADTPTTLIYMHVYEKPPSIREKNPEVPPAVEALVMKMLMKEPAERFQTPTELVNAIEALESGTYDASAGPMTLEIGAAEGSTISASVASAAEKVSKPSTSLIPLIAVMLILLAGVGVAIFLLSQKQKPKEEESPVVTVPPMQVPERLPTQQPPPQLPVVQPPTVQPPVMQPPIQPEKKEMVKFPAAQILAKLPVGSSLFIRKAQEPETLKQPLLADKEFEAGLYVVSAEKKGYQPISVNFKLEKSGVEPPVDSVKWEFELSEKVKDALRLIKVHIEEQKYRLAMDELENLLKEVSDLEEAQTLLARCKKEYEDFQKIEEDFNEAKRLLKDEEWEKALVVLKRIPTSYKGYEQKVLPLIKQANDELKKSAQFKNLVETARNELKKGEIESTQTYLQMAQNLIPNAKEVTDLLDSVKKLRQIKEDVKIEVDRKNYRVAFKLSEDYLKSAPLCERMRKQQEFIRGEIEKIEASMKRLEAECQTYNATIESSPKDALTAAIKAQEEVKLLRDIFGQDVKESEEKVRTMLERAEVAVAKKGVCDTIKSLDSLFLSGKMNEIVAVVDDQNSALQKRLSKQLSDFFLSGIRVVLSEHKVEQITLSSDKDSAVATCTYSYYFIHSESNVELKGEKK